MFMGRSGNQVSLSCVTEAVKLGGNRFLEEQWQKDTHQNMRSAREAAQRGTPPNGFASLRADPKRLLNIVLDTLDAAKAENVACIDLRGKTSIGDHMVLA